MPTDETTTLEPTGHAGQVDQPVSEPAVPELPAVPVADASVIALEPTGHSDQVQKMYGNAEPGMYPLYGVTSFGELEQLEAVEERTYQVGKLTEQFQLIVGNIMRDEGIANKEPALNRLTAEFTARINQSRRPKEKAGFWASIRNLFTKQTKEDVDILLPEQVTAPFMVWKQADDTLRWFAIYSNQFRDVDNPPEIISEQSHKSFVDLVSAGVLDYPELWHWHIPGTRWGQADWLDYADGFAVASGTVDLGHEKEAEALSQLDDIRVSHGMPSRFIVRSKDDPTIIDFHVTAEISPLPGWAAANPLTGFVVMKELEDMTEVKGIRPEQKEHLLKLGMAPERVAEVENILSTLGKAATDAGLESKETEPVTNAAAETPVATPAYVTAQEVADAVGALVTPITQALAAMTSQLASMQDTVKALKESDETKVAKAADATPAASLQALMAQTIFGVNSPAMLDGRTTLAKAGPKQAAAEADQITGIGHIDQLIARSRAEVTQ